MPSATGNASMLDEDDLAERGGRAHERVSRSASSSSIIASPNKRRRIEGPTPGAGERRRGALGVAHLVELEGLELEGDEDAIKARVKACTHHGGTLVQVDLDAAATQWWRKARSGTGAQYAFSKLPPERLETEAWTLFQHAQPSDADLWRKRSAVAGPHRLEDRLLPVPEDGHGMLAKLLPQKGLLYVHAAHDSRDAAQSSTSPSEAVLERTVRLYPPASDHEQDVDQDLTHADDRPVELLIPVHIPGEEHACPGQSRPRWYAYEHRIADVRKLSAQLGQAAPIIWTLTAFDTMLLLLQNMCARVATETTPSQAETTPHANGGQPPLIVSVRSDASGDCISILMPWSSLRRMRWHLAQLRTPPEDGAEGPAAKAATLPTFKVRGRRLLPLQPVPEDDEGSTASEESTELFPARGVLLPVQDPSTREWIALC